MKPHTYIIIFLIFLLASCTSWKDTLVVRGNKNDAVRNAIIDFLHSDKLQKKDTVFAVKIKSINNQILGISILGFEAKLIPNQKNKIGTNYPGFPTQYLDREGKLFYWYDSTYSISHDLIATLSKYRLIDSVNITGVVRYHETIGFDDSKMAAHYYFCLCNLRKYKKVHMIAAMGYYKPPTLKCDCTSAVIGVVPMLPQGFFPHARVSPYAAARVLFAAAGLLACGPQKGNELTGSPFAR